MKKVFSLFILLSLIVGVVTVPTNAKSTSKTKTMMMCFEDEDVEDEYGTEIICTIPYDSKWKPSQEVVYGTGCNFVTPKKANIQVMIMYAGYDQSAELLYKYLTKKKYKKELYKYLCDSFDVDEENADSYFKLKKDGNGKYIIIIDIESEYGVIRPLDGKHLLLFHTEAKGKTVSKSLKTKMVTYIKQVTLEKKPLRDNDIDPAVDILDVKLNADKVVFSELYTNMAWGYQKQAIYIMGDGRVYTYDYVKNPGGIEDISSEESVIEYLKDKEPAARLKNDYLMLMYSYAVKVDPDAKYTTKHEMYDYGQKNLYFHTADGSKVKIASTGDVRYIYDDKYANKLEKLWDNWYRYCE